MNQASAQRTGEKIIAEQRATMTTVAAPPMKEVKIRDQSGRTITEWEGRASWMREFTQEPKKVVAINTR